MIQSIAHHSILKQNKNFKNKATLTRFEVGTEVSGHVYECLETNAVDVIEIGPSNAPLADSPVDTFQVSFNTLRDDGPKNHNAIARSVYFKQAHKVEDPCEGDLVLTPKKSKILVPADVSSSSPISNQSCDPIIETCKSEETAYEEFLRLEQSRELSAERSVSPSKRPHGFSLEGRCMITEAMRKILDQIAEHGVDPNETAEDAAKAVEKLSLQTKES